MLVIEKIIMTNIFLFVRSAIMLKRRKNGPGHQSLGVDQLIVHSAENPVKRTKKLHFI